MTAEIQTKPTFDRVWTPFQVFFASFFAGPLGGCYLISKNYKDFGDELNSKRWWILGIVFTLVLITVAELFEIPNNFLRIAPIAYTVSFFSYAKKQQGSQIKELLNSGIKRHSYFRLVLISLFFLCLEFAYGFTLGFLASFFNQTS